MSVLVKGMDMPENCFQCPCLDGEYCVCQAVDSYEIVSMKFRPPFCPLIEVPKNEWRDMNEEQPTDGTLAVVGWWTEGNWWHAETDVYEHDEESERERWCYNDSLVTHWMPLPDPPKGENE